MGKNVRFTQKRVKNLVKFAGSGFRVPGSGFRVPGSGFQVPGSWILCQTSAFLYEWMNDYYVSKQWCSLTMGWGGLGPPCLAKTVVKVGFRSPQYLRQKGPKIILEAWAPPNIKSMTTPLVKLLHQTYSSIYIASTVPKSSVELWTLTSKVVLN